MIIDPNKAFLDENGIYRAKLGLSKEQELSQKSWESIYSFDESTLSKDRILFEESKLKDHMLYISKSFCFKRDDVYLEIGCGPAHIGEHLMKKYGVFFVGIDFNYAALVVLSKRFKKLGLQHYILIHGNISDLPILNNSVDFIYGGGVIEHSSDTLPVLTELYRVLKTSGVSFNTVPAFNMFWLTRFFYSIPTTPFFRKPIEYLHLHLLSGRILEKHFGYELSFSKNYLKNLHKKVGFKKVIVDKFPFHPSTRSKLFSEFFFFVTNFIYTTPFYCVYAKK